MVVTTGAIGHAKLQSNHHLQQTNTQFFLQLGSPSCCATNSVKSTHSKLLLDNSASFTASRMKDLRQKWKVKLMFRGTCKLSGTGIVECVEIVDVGCNLK